MLKSTTGIELALAIGETHPLSTMSEILQQIGIFVKRGGQYGELLCSDKSGEKTFHMTMDQALDKCMAAVKAMAHQKGLTCHQYNCIEEAEGELHIIAEAWRRRNPAASCRKEGKGRPPAPPMRGDLPPGWYACSEDGEVSPWEEDYNKRVHVQGFKEKFDPQVAF